MTHVLSLATVLTPSSHLRNRRLFQSPSHRHTTVAHAIFTTTHAKGGVCCAYVNILHQSQQGQQAQVQQESPDLSRLDPALRQQWDHAANAQLGNIEIKPQSREKVWWICDQCPDGHRHSWSATVYSRISGTGCPQCSSHKVCKHNSLATKAPLVAAQWDYEANVGTPDDVVAQSSKMARWHCLVCGCKWEATLASRVSIKKTGCPQCAENGRANKRIKHPTFAECNHPLLAEWDHDRNADHGHFPDQVTLRSNKQISWLCTKCPAGQQHSWSAMPHTRTGRNKTGCPFCAGKAACRCNSLQALYPEAAAEWDYSENQGHPSDYTASSSRVVWWCSPQGARRQQTIISRTLQVQRKMARLKRIEEHQVSVGRPAIST